MASADRPVPSAPSPSDVARRCNEAGFVRVMAAADGDAVAAAGLLGRAMTAAGIPFHASVHRVADVTRSTDAGLTVGLGCDRGDIALTGVPVSSTAYEIAAELGSDPDPILALAGVIAAGMAPAEEAEGLLETATESGLVERQPGVVIPTTDLIDGLAHSTMIHTSFSGDVDSAGTILADIDRGEADRRHLASLVALAGIDDAPPRAASAVERAIRPLETDEPFATVGGYADVLEASANEQPGTALALALGHGGRAGALETWRDHATRVHAAVRSADFARHRGLVVVRTDTGAVRTIARLVLNYRSPEPIVVVTTDDAAGIATDGTPARSLLQAGPGADGEPAITRGRTGEISIADPDAFIAAVREAV